MNCTGQTLASLIIFNLVFMLFAIFPVFNFLFSYKLVLENEIKTVQHSGDIALQAYSDDKKGPQAYSDNKKGPQAYSDDKKGPQAYLNDEKAPTTLQAVFHEMEITEENLKETIEDFEQNEKNISKTDTEVHNHKPETVFLNSSIYSLTSLELMKMPKIDFLPGLKNPCFFVQNPPKNDAGVWMSDNVVLKCWPYYQLIGVEKCGTTDLYHRLHQHHHLLGMRNKKGAIVKEPLWYNGWFLRELHNNTVGGYLSLMDNATQIIKHLCPNSINNTKNSDVDHREKLCPYLTGDFSARTINHNFFWDTESENINLTVPRILVSDKLYRINPNTKIIIMLRDPITRLLSDYKFYSRGGVIKNEKISSQDFHTRVVEAIEMWEICVSRFKFHEDTCANGFQWARRRNIQTGHFWDHNSVDRLRVSIYSIYVNDWLRLFPRKNILVIKMEEYSAKPLEYIEKYVLPFLELEPFKSETRKYLLALEANNVQYNRQPKKEEIQIWNKTRTLLGDFFEPYNRQLADMLGDQKFLWK